MTTRRHAVAMTLACGLLASALGSPARADEGQFTLGSQWWSQTVAEAKYQEFREVPRGGFLENFLWTTYSGRTSLTLWGANGLHRDQITRLSLANGAKWRLDLGYQQIPHVFSQVARTPYVEVSPGGWVLPDSLQYRNQTNSGGYTARMGDLLANSPGVPLQFSTNLSKARLRVRPTRGWQFEARGEQRERSGNKPYAMTFGFSTAIEIPEPIHQRMIDGDVIANYQRDEFKLQAIGGVSTFKNFISTLLVDNPKRITDVSGGDGPKVGALDLYPDNHVIRGSLAMSYLMPRSTALTATLGLSQGKQDDAFLKPTSNTALGRSTLDSLPARSLSGEVNQMVSDVRLRTNLVEKLEGTLTFHYTKYENKTPQLLFTGFTPYDVSWQRWIGLETDPANYSQWVGGANLEYALPHSIHLGGTAEYRVRERTFREVEKDKETVLGARARSRPLPDMQLELRYSHGDRKLDSFLSDDYLGFRVRTVGPSAGVYDSLAQIEQPDLRRYDVASRVQDKGTGSIAYAVGERADVSVSYSGVLNDYKETKLGLQNDKDQSVAASSTIHVNDRFDVNGSFGMDWARTNQASRTSAAAVSLLPVDNWTANLIDDDQYAQTGFDWELRPDKLNLAGDYQFSRHVAEFHFTNGANNSADLPNTLYRLHQLQIETRYQWQKNTSVAARYGWEEYDINDWAMIEVPLIFPVTGTASSIFLGDGVRSYRAHRIALLLRHSF